MKKMNVTAVLVILVSATNVFANATCDAIASERVTITQAENSIKELNDAIIQFESQMIRNQMDRKDDSLILGNGQERLQAISFQLHKSRAYRLADIETSESKIRSLEAELTEKCEEQPKAE